MAEPVHVEYLLSRRVRALNGRIIGRLQEIRAESEADACYIAEYRVGAYAFLLITDRYPPFSLQP